MHVIDIIHVLFAQNASATISGSTTMLTMTYLSLDSRDQLPRVTYATALDTYVLMCFLFVFATIVQFAAVHHFTKHMEREHEFAESESDEEVNIYCYHSR